MDIATIFKLVSNRAKFARLFALVGPAIEAVKPNVPEIVSIGREIAAEFFPALLAQGTSNNPLASFDVKWLQARLNMLGQKLTVDGDYGQATRDAVTAFQKAHGQVADGWAGVETCSAILVALSKTT